MQIWAVILRACSTHSRGDGQEASHTSIVASFRVLVDHLDANSIRSDRNHDGHAHTD
jgi:hypothetical protein